MGVFPPSPTRSSAVLPAKKGVFECSANMQCLPAEAPPLVRFEIDSKDRVTEQGPGFSVDAVELVRAQRRVLVRSLKGRVPHEPLGIVGQRARAGPCELDPLASARVGS